MSLRAGGGWQYLMSTRGKLSNVITFIQLENTIHRLMSPRYRSLKRLLGELWLWRLCKVHYQDMTHIEITTNWRSLLENISTFFFPSPALSTLGCKVFTQPGTDFLYPSPFSISDSPSCYFCVYLSALRVPMTPSSQVNMQ